MSFLIGLGFLSCSIGFLTHSPAWGFFTLGSGLVFAGLFDGMIEYLDRGRKSESVASEDLEARGELIP